MFITLFCKQEVDIDQREEEVIFYKIATFPKIDASDVTSVISVVLISWSFHLNQSINWIIKAARNRKRFLQSIYA